MTEPRNLLDLPADLPVPVDDGACDHLPGMRLPSLALPATDGTMIDLSSSGGHCLRLSPHGAARAAVADRLGRDPRRPRLHAAVVCLSRPRRRAAALGARIFGLSTQDTAYQQEAVERLHLPFPLLSDERLELLTTALLYYLRGRWHDSSSG